MFHVFQIQYKCLCTCCIHFLWDICPSFCPTDEKDNYREYKRNKVMSMPNWNSLVGILQFLSQLLKLLTFFAIIVSHPWFKYMTFTYSPLDAIFQWSSWVKLGAERLDLFASCADYKLVPTDQETCCLSRLVSFISSIVYRTACSLPG